MTDIYNIATDGEISLVASYSLPKEQALKCFVLQRRRRYDTWNYKGIEVPLKFHNGRYYYFLNDNSTLFTN